MIEINYAKTEDLVASFGRPLPVCADCNARMVMSCREAYSAEPLIFTFECRNCRMVMQRVKVQVPGQQTIEPPRMERTDGG